MADKKTVRTLKFKAEFEKAQNFGTWIQSIEKNIDAATHKSFNAWIKEYKTKLESLSKTMSTMGDNPKTNVMAAMHADMNKMVPLAKKIADAFSKISLGDVGQAINDAAKKVDAASKKQRQSKNNKRNWERKLSSDGGLSNSELERIYNTQISKKPLTVKGKTYGGEGGLDAAQFVADFKKNAQAFYQARNELQKIVEDRVSHIEKRIQEEADALVTNTKELQDASEELKKLQNSSGANTKDTEISSQAVTGQQSAQEFGAAVEDTKEAAKAVREENEAKNQGIKATEDYNKETKKTPGLVKKAATQVFTYGTVMTLFRTVVNNGKRTIIEMDKALTDMAVVTNLTREEAWKFTDTMQELAKQVGATTTEVAQVITKFLQQGKSLTQATQLAEAAIMGAKIAGIDASRSVDLLTNAMNGFQLSASQALEVSDKFAALAAASATDYEELAVALSKVAAQANLAGMSIDFTLGMLAKGIEVTREAPETIGTALKTVISRMRELTDYGETLEEGMDVNRVETALANVGVKLRDTNGQFRDLELVLTELGGKWKSLNVNQQANVAVALAGTRQQSRLIAMMQDFDRTLELVDISTNSYGATMAQHAEYMGSLQAATDGLKTSYEGLITAVTNSEVLIKIVGLVSELVQGATWVVQQSWLMIPILVLLSGYGISILNTKKLQHQYEKATLKLQQHQTIEENKQRLATIQKLKTSLKQKKVDLEAIKNALENNEIQEDTTEAALALYKEKAKQEGNSAEALRIQNEINALNQDDVQQLGLKATINNEIANTQLEIDQLEAEENLIKSQNIALLNQQAGATGGLQAALGGISIAFSTILGLLTSILTITLLVNKAKKESIKLSLKSIATTLKEKAVDIGHAFVKMAKSVGSIPVWGWVVAAGLLAAAGIAVAAAAGAFKSKEEKDTEEINDNIKAVQKLQGEIYNLGQEVKTVSKIGDEFETLSSKINKTAEEVARLDELIQEFNDAVGFELIAPGTDADAALNLMKGYEAVLNSQLQDTIAESKKILDDAITSGSRLAKYLENSSGKSAIKQIISQTYSDFGQASEMTQTIVMKTIENNTDDFVQDGGGFDIDKIKDLFDTDLIKQMDEAIASNSLAEYKAVLESTHGEVREFLEDSDSLFSAVSKLDSAVLNKIDSLKLNAEQLAQLAPIMQEIEELIQSNPDATKGDVINLTYENRMEQFDANLRTETDIEKAIEDADEELKEFLNENYSGNRGDRRKGMLEELGFDKRYIDRDWFTDVYDIQGLAKKLQSADSLTKEEEEVLEAILEQSGDLQTKIDEAKNAQKVLNTGVTEWYNEFGDIKGITAIQDNITKTESSLEKLSKAASGELSDTELDELLQTYPKLIEYFKDGTLSANELNEARKELFNETQQNVNDNLDLIASKNELLFKDYGLDWTEFMNLDESDPQAIEQAVKDFNQKVIKEAESLPDLFGIRENFIKNNTISEAETDEMIGAWQEYAQHKFKSTNFAETGFLSEAEWKKVGESTGLVLAKAQYNSYKKQMELYAPDSEQYTEFAALSADAAANAIEQAQKDKNKFAEEISTGLSGYDWEVIDGELFYKDATGMLFALSEIQDKEIKETFATFANANEELISDYQEADDEILENAQNFADTYVNIKKQQYEQEIEEIEKRKEAYEKYFEEVDALEEEQERAQSKEDIISQLSALSGGIDGTSKAKIKELQGQLNDLIKEEAEAKKEEARNAILEDLDNQSESLNNNIEELDNTALELVQSILGLNGTIANISGFTYDANSTLSFTEQFEHWQKTGYATPEQLNSASNGKEEETDVNSPILLNKITTSFLTALGQIKTINPTDMFDELVGSFKSFFNIDATTDEIQSTTNNTSSVSVGDINITTGPLDKNTTSEDVANAVVGVFRHIGNARGVNKNVKK